MAVKKKTNRRKTTTAAPKTRRKPAARKTRKSSGNFVNFFVPLFFILCILFCLGFLGFMGYRTVTASSFFDVKTVEVRGANRISASDVEKIVRSESAKNGVWNADLELIRSEIEKNTFVKTATVSRILPDGIRVNIVERVPKAVVRIEGGDFWADADGIVLIAVGKDEDRPPFVIQGWDREKNEKAQENNRARVKMYLEMLEEWQEYELAKRVKAVDLSDLREPFAITEDSGERVSIQVEKEHLSKRLQDGIKAIAGKGGSYQSVNLEGSNLILVPRKN